MHDTDATADVISGVTHIFFVLLVGITGTFKHVLPCIKFNKTSGKNLQYPLATCALICAEVVINYDIIVVHLRDVCSLFLQVHICNI